MTFGVATVALILSSCTTTESNVAETNSRHFEFSYTVTVDLDSADLKPIDIWIPIAQTDAHQEIESVEIITDMTYETILDSEYQNKVLHLFDSASTGKQQAGSSLLLR